MSGVCDIARQHVPYLVVIAEDCYEGKGKITDYLKRTDEEALSFFGAVLYHACGCEGCQEAIGRDEDLLEAARQVIVEQLKQAGIEVPMGLGSLWDNPWLRPRM